LSDKKNTNDPVSVIINVYNEAETIEKEIRDIHSIIISKLPGSEFIVAEDGSNDGTKEIILQLKHELGIIHSTSDERKGYAKALKDAISLAKNPYIFFSDTGNKFNYDDFWKLYEIHQKYDLVIGLRTNRKDQFNRRLLTWLYNFTLRTYFKVNLRDADSGFRIYETDMIKRISNENWVNKHLITSELALRAIYKGHSVKEVPVSYMQRSGISRGLPPHKIPTVIAQVLWNFSDLKKSLS